MENKRANYLSLYLEGITLTSSNGCWWSWRQRCGTETNRPLHCSAFWINTNSANPRSYEILDQFPRIACTRIQCTGFMIGGTYTAALSEMRSCRIPRSTSNVGRKYAFSFACIGRPRTPNFREMIFDYSR